MHAGEIVHVNVVPNTGTIGCWIVRAKNLQGRPGAGRSVQSQWNQVGLGIVKFADFPALIRTSGVEVTQTGVAKVVSAIIGFKRLLEKQLRNAVGVDRLARNVLLDRN